MAFSTFWGLNNRKMCNNFTMEFFKYSKNLLKNKQKTQTYSTNPFKQNKQVTFVWVENSEKSKSNYWSDSS